MSKNTIRHLAALALTMAATPWAAAGLLGTQVDVKYHLTGLPDTSDVVLVDNAVELTCPGSANLCSMLTAPTQTVDIGDSSIHYTFVSATGQGSGFNPVAVNGFDFQMLQFGVPLVDFVLTTNIAGLDDARITLDADRLQVHMAGLALGPSAFFHIELVGASLPEPPVALLLAASLAGLGWRRRTRG